MNNVLENRGKVYRLTILLTDVYGQPNQEVVLNDISCVLEDHPDYELEEIKIEALSAAEYEKLI
jgi:hypothetical protein